MKIPGNTANLTRTAGVIADRAGRLAKATTATIRRTLIHVPARLARSARRITLHLPKAWPWQNAFTRLIIGDKGFAGREFESFITDDLGAHLIRPDRKDETPWLDRKSTRLNSSHYCASRMPSSA